MHVNRFVMHVQTSVYIALPFSVHCLQKEQKFRIVYILKCEFSFCEM